MAGLGGSSKSLMGKFANGHCFAATTSMERLILLHEKIQRQMLNGLTVIWPWFENHFSMLRGCFEVWLRALSNLPRKHHKIWHSAMAFKPHLDANRRFAHLARMNSTEQTKCTFGCYTSITTVHPWHIHSKEIFKFPFLLNPIEHKFSAFSNYSAIVICAVHAVSWAILQPPTPNTVPPLTGIQKSDCQYMVWTYTWQTGTLHPWRTHQKALTYVQGQDRPAHVHAQKAKICTDNSQHCDLHWCPVIQSNLLQRLISLQETSPFNELTKLCCESITANTISLSELTESSQLNVIPQRQQQNHTLP